MSGLRCLPVAFKLARMLSDGGRFPRLRAAGWAVVSTLNVAADALAEPLWDRLGPRALWAALAAVMASLGLPWVLPLHGWWSLVNMAVSWYLGGVVGNVFSRWLRWRAGHKRFALMEEAGVSMDAINGRHLWYDLDGKPISVQEANDLLGKWLPRQVALTEFEGGWAVSTIFTVLDQACTKPEWTGAPILWETAIFDSSGNIDEIYRYTSREDASRGHDRVVSELRNVFDQMKGLNAPDTRGSRDKG